MPGKKHKFTLKEDRQIKHIIESERKKGMGLKESKSIGYATLQKIKGSKKHGKNKKA